MRDRKKENLKLIVECHECNDCYSLKDWQKHGVNNMNINGELKLDAEDPEDVIDDVMMDCPGCDALVYLSDGSIN
jgi:hypothetical protein